MDARLPGSSRGSVANSLKFSRAFLVFHPAFSFRDGSSGTATFVFSNPTIFDNLTELGDITGFYMIDDEGTIQVRLMVKWSVQNMQNEDSELN